MFSKLRKPGQTRGNFLYKMLTYVLFALICIVFVFLFAVPGQMGIGQGGIAAVVNKSTISMGDFEEAYRRISSRQGNLNTEQTNQMRAQTLEGLVNNELIYQAAQKEGLRVSDAELSDFIRSIPGFQKDGRFQRQIYDSYISGTGTSQERFEKSLKKDLLIQKMQNLFSVVTVPKVSGELLDSFGSLKANISYIKLDEDKIKKFLSEGQTSEAYVADIDKLLSEKNFDGAVQKLKTAGLGWDKTGDFQLSGASVNVPGIGYSNEVVKAALKAGKDNIVPYTILSENTRFIVKLTDKKNEKPAFSLASLNLLKSAGATMQNWVESKKEKSKVIRKLPYN